MPEKIYFFRTETTIPKQQLFLLLTQKQKKNKKKGSNNFTKKGFYKLIPIKRLCNQILIFTAREFYKYFVTGNLLIFIKKKMRKGELSPFRLI